MVFEFSLNEWGQVVLRVHCTRDGARTTENGATTFYQALRILKDLLLTFGI